MEDLAAFLNEEIRCGFKISSDMKKAWAISMAVLNKVAKICRKYGIKYYLDCGSLLGAVRHGGFIPWDDDIDISVMRKDFEPLMRILAKELPEPYVVNSIYTQKGHNTANAAIANRSRIDVGSASDQEISRQFYDLPYVCGIDIYPIDKLPDDDEELKEFLLLYNIVYFVLFNYDRLAKDGELEEHLTQVEELCGVSISRDSYEKTRDELKFLEARVAGLYADEDCERCTFIQFSSGINLDTSDLSRMFKKTEWFEKTVTLPFEHIFLEAPAGYQKLLEFEFGDYMTIRKFTTNHEYPFFKAQEIKRRQYLGLNCDDVDQMWS